MFSQPRATSTERLDDPPVAPAKTPTIVPILSAPAELEARFRQVRARSLALRAPLSVEDCALQSMPDASPVKWHLAHSTWFFETFVLSLARPPQPAFDDAFLQLFNSYYEALGPRPPRDERGLQSRPSLVEVEAYRHAIDARVSRLLAEAPSAEILRRVEIGIQHEQQHQELLLTDILHALSRSARYPAYREEARRADRNEIARSPLAFVPGPTGIVRLGHDDRGFAFDNEGPSHRVFLEPHALGTRVLTNREALAFIEAGGYREPSWWLSAGFDFVLREGVTAPLYWTRRDDRWQRFSLDGLVDLDLDAPVCHVSYYEADALARFVGARLPTEAEWEATAKTTRVTGNFAESERFSPAAVAPTGGVDQLFGDVWEWTSSSYTAYPGYRAEGGALGEYNGKFMVGQQVLRGGSCFSPEAHLRASYRNFFPPSARWQMSGVRVARSL